jgi:hypothetical protein
MKLYDAFIKCWFLEKHYLKVENSGSYFIEQNGDCLRIYFEQSNGFVDWVHNLVFPAKPYKRMKHLWFCHRGFLKVWKSIEPYLADAIANPEVRNIEIVGYSHGAAIALLCYEYCVFNRPDADVWGVGFGCPRVFWGFVPKAVKKRFNNFKVVRNGNDIVTHVPPALFGFRHITEIIEIGKNKSEGPIDDHRPKNYLLHLHETE